MVVPPNFCLTCSLHTHSNPAPGMAQIKQGAKFVSDTDTEVIPKLCEYIHRNLQEPLPLNEVRDRAAHMPQCVMPKGDAL